MKETNEEDSLQKQAKRVEIARLMALRYTQSEIVKELGFSQPTVSRLMDEVRDIWARECAESLEESKQRYLAENALIRRRLFKDLDDPEKDAAKTADAIGNIQEREMRMLGIGSQKTPPQPLGNDGANLDDSELLRRWTARKNLIAANGAHEKNGNGVAH